MYLIYFIPWQLFFLTDAKIIRFLASGNLLSWLLSPFDMALIVFDSFPCLSKCQAVFRFILYIFNPDLESTQGALVSFSGEVVDTIIRH